MSYKIAKARKELQDYFARRGRIKFAQGNQDVKASFEQNFFALVQSIVDEYFPTLSRYALGFQLIEKSKDNSKAFGIYAFRLKSLAFMPFFFDNGKVSGYEIIYLPRLDIFLPTTEAWITYLKTKDSKGFGEILTKDVSSFLTSSQPNLLPLRRPVAYTLGSSLILDDTIKISSIIKKASYTKSKTNYRNLILQNKKLAFALLNLIDKYPALLDRFAQNYGINFIKKAMDISRQIQLGPEPPITVFTELDIDRYPLPANYVAAIKRRGFIIRDTRTKFASLVPEISGRLQAITSTGCYQIMTPSGDIIEGFAIIPKHSEFGFLIPFGGKLVRYFRVKPQPTAFATGAILDKDYSDAYATLPKTKRSELLNPEFWEELAVKIGDERGVTMILLDKRGNGYVIRGIIREDEMKPIRIKLVRTYPTQLASDQVVELVATNMDEMETRSHSGQLYLAIPKEVAYVVLSENMEPLVSLTPEDYWRGLQKEGAMRVKVAHFRDHDLYKVNGSDGLNRLDAVLELMKYGLKQKDAEKVLNEAVRYQRAEYWVKPAYKVLDEERPSFFFADEVTTSFAPGYPAKAPFESAYVIPGLKKPQPRTNILEPVDEKAIKVLMKLDEANEGEVFDAGVFTILIKATRDEYLIDMYIPNLVKSLDTLGRLLFNLYYHRERLTERYGETDYTKLLDSVKTNLESLGDLVIDLMQKDIDYYAGMLAESQQFTEGES